MDAALSAIDKGWFVFPSCWPDSAGNCACGYQHKIGGKAPLNSSGFNGATRDLDQIAMWDERWPLANLSIAIGTSGLFIIDLDGAEAIAEGTRLGLPSSLWVKTGNGQHWYYQKPSGMPKFRSTNRGASGKIDLLADGALIVPPSMHYSGRQYEWQGPDLSELPEPPPWAVEMLRIQAEKPRALVEAGVVVAAAEIELPPVPLSDDGLKVWEGESYSGDRSRALASLSMHLALGGLREEGVLAGTLKGWDAARGNSSPKGPKYTGRRDGDARYMEMARSALMRVAERDQKPIMSGGVKSIYVALSDEYADRYPNGMMIDDQWYEYAGGIWDKIDKYLVEYRIQQIMGDKMKTGVVLGVERALRGRFSKTSKVWDESPDVIVCQNGAVDVYTGQIYDHSPEFMARKQTEYFYDAEAFAPTWEAFIADRFAPDVAEWLQEFAGICLTRDMSHEVAVWLYSPPGAGKSTFIAGMEKALGAARAGRLSLADIARNPRFSLVNIPGKTMLVAAEQPSTWVETSDIINSLISGDTITVEAKHQNSYEARPVAKILWGMNELPRFQSANDGIFRRVKIVKMQALKKLDPTIKDRVEKEGAGILNWAMAGLRRLMLSGESLASRTPETIRAAGSEFRRGNDVVGTFFEERIDLGEEYRVQAQELYDSYSAWCMRNGYRSKSRNTVGADWTRMGLEQRQSKGRTWYKGAKLRDLSQGEIE